MTSSETVDPIVDAKPRKRKRRTRPKSRDEQTAPDRPRLTVGFRSAAELRMFHAAAKELELDDSALGAQLIMEGLAARQKRKPATWPSEPPPKLKHRRGWSAATPAMLGLAMIDDRVCAALDRESHDDD